MKFDDIFNEYKKISGKNETEIKKPWGLFALIIILMVTAAIFWLFTPYKWVGFLPYAIAFLPLFRIKKIMDQIDRTELENRQFEQMESFLAENHIYDKNAPLDFLCIDALIQDGEKILPRYKKVDLGELIGGKRCINRIFFRAFIFDILVSSSLSKWRFCFERRN